MSDLLTPDEVQQVTGCTQAAKQCEVLRNSGVRYIRRADGRPVLTWTAINNTLSPQASLQSPEGDGFNIEGLNH